MFDAFKSFDADPAADVAVLTGAGGAFCAGADLKAIADGETRPIEPGGEFGPMGPTRLALGKPVIAAIEGPAVAGGMELALWCDLRIAARSAVFGVFNRRFGVPLIDLGTIRLPRIVGHGRALELILTGRAVSAEEALHIGLVNEVTEDGQALSRAVALARTLSGFPQTAMRNDRMSAIEQWELGRAAGNRQRGRLGAQDARQRRSVRRLGALQGRRRPPRRYCKLKPAEVAHFAKPGERGHLTGRAKPRPVWSRRGLDAMGSDPGDRDDEAAACARGSIGCRAN